MRACVRACVQVCVFVFVCVRVLQTVGAGGAVDAAAVPQACRQGALVPCKWSNLEMVKYVNGQTRNGQIMPAAKWPS